MSRTRTGLPSKLSLLARDPIPNLTYRSRETLEYFMSLDIRIFEIYGMSESSGPQLSTTSENQKLCTIGKELPGFWAKITAADGELCVKGRHVMMGYLNNPEKTAEVLGEDGWLRSGDIASKVRHGI